MRNLAIFAAALSFSTAAYPADPRLLNLVMPDAKAVAGVNVSTVKVSPFGAFLMSQIGANGAQALQHFGAETGFDPTRDANELLVASNGAAGSHAGLVLALGTFDTAKISAIAQSKGAAVTNYAGALLITPHEKGALAFIGSSIAVAGDADSVKAALDRANGSNAIDSSLATRIQTLSTTEDIWAVSTESLAALLPRNGAATQGAGAQALEFAKSIQSSSGGVKFGSTIDITGQAIADTAQNAEALANVIRMVASLVEMNGSQNANTAPLADLLKTLNVTTDGNTVNLKASLAESQVEDVIRKASASKPAAAHRNGRM
jgi:hypothetical protein